MSFRGPSHGRASRAGNVVEAQDTDPLAALINPNILKKHLPHPPRLIWPSVIDAAQMQEKDDSRIPSIDFIERRRAHNKKQDNNGMLMLGCKEFWEELRRCSLVIIFDVYMTGRLLRRLREELSPQRARNLKSLILIGGMEEVETCRKLSADIVKNFADDRRSLALEYRYGLKRDERPFPHDRFAVTDAEFWHFGGTAGGLEHCLTAVSRGWRAQDVNVIDLVKATWSALPQSQSNLGVRDD